MSFFRNPKLFHNFIHLLPVNASIGLFAVNKELMDVYTELMSSQLFVGA
jgi:hypothetical protein